MSAMLSLDVALKKSPQHFGDKDCILKEREKPFAA